MLIPLFITTIRIVTSLHCQLTLITKSKLRPKKLTQKVNKKA